MLCCRYVLPDHMLLHMSEVSPREVQGVLACCAPIPPLVRQHVQEIHQLIQQTRQSRVSVKKNEGKETAAKDSHVESGSFTDGKTVMDEEQPVKWMSCGLVSNGPPIQLALPIHTVFEDEVSHRLMAVPVPSISPSILLSLIL